MLGAMRRTVRVELGPRSYDVIIGAGALAEVGARSLDAAVRPARAMIVHDDALPAELCLSVCASVRSAGMTCETVATHASEPDKSLARLAPILGALARARLERRDILVALGGGIVGDLAGFAAAVYRRGIPFIQCPTTLLAMVDASVGGKTGVNLEVGGGLRKNMAGAFHQPRAVIADVSALATLPARHFRAGLAECIKHALIAGDQGDPALLDWAEASLPAILRREAGALVELIARNVAVKARVVSGDEFETAPDEQGGRAILNLGHTFGHAIETLPALSPDGDPAHAPLHHGEAVALGLVAAAACAGRLGLADPTLARRVVAILTTAGLPTKARGLPSNRQVMDLMSHDKKVAGGKLRLVLPTDPGHAKVVADPPAAAVEAGLDAIRA